MKIITASLIGAALDWAVAKCLNVKGLKISNGFPIVPMEEFHRSVHYSQSWAEGGPIIEREKIRLVPFPPEREKEGWWAGANYGASGESRGNEGQTPLIAAMRCFVASKLGDEVEVPEGLV